MAVVNVYARASYLSGGIAPAYVPKMDQALFEQGSDLVIMTQNFSPTAGDSTGSTYRIWANVDSSLVPIMISIASDALAGFTSASLGLYLPNNGAVVNANLLANAFTLANAITSLYPKVALDGLSNVGLAFVGQKLWQLAGVVMGTTALPPMYDIVLTANATPAAGNISIFGIFARG